MKKSKDIIKIIVLVSIIVFKINFEVYASLAYSPEEGSKIESFIEKNNDLLSSEEKSNLNDIVIKLNKYIRECQLSIIRKKLGDAQFEEYKKLIEKRSSGSEFQQEERFRLYELEKLLR